MIKKLIPKKIKLIMRQIRDKFLPLILKLQLFILKIIKPKKGTGNWLILKELYYGGLVINVPRKAISEHDSRTKEEMFAGGMIGGDRMSNLCHDYAKIYSKYLEKFINKDKKEKIVLVEVGILRGTGLAIWSELFPNSRIIGLDIDLGNIERNMKNLKKRGAFKNDNLELYTFDQFKDNKDLLKKVLKGDKIDILIDDGVHSNETIIKTIDSSLPHLSNDFIYFIEDNNAVHNIIKEKYCNLKVEDFNEISVLQNAR